MENTWLNLNIKWNKFILAKKKYPIVWIYDRSAENILLENKMSIENNALSMKNSDIIHSGQEKNMFENVDEAAKYAAEQRFW